MTSLYCCLYCCLATAAAHEANTCHGYRLLIMYNQRTSIATFVNAIGLRHVSYISDHAISRSSSATSISRRHNERVDLLRNAVRWGLYGISMCASSSTYISPEGFHAKLLLSVLKMIFLSEFHLCSLIAKRKARFIASRLIAIYRHKFFISRFPDANFRSSPS